MPVISGFNQFFSLNPTTYNKHFPPFCVLFAKSKHFPLFLEVISPLRFSQTTNKKCSKPCFLNGPFFFFLQAVTAKITLECMQVNTHLNVNINTLLLCYSSQFSSRTLPNIVQQLFIMSLDVSKWLLLSYCLVWVWKGKQDQRTGERRWWWRGHRTLYSEQRNNNNRTLCIITWWTQPSEKCLNTFDA